MGDVHQIGTSKASHARLLEQWIVEIISQHPDKAVAERWTEMARETAVKFPGPPSPSQTEINLNNLLSLSADDKDVVLNELERFIGSYFDDVRQQLMQIHAELLGLGKHFLYYFKIFNFSATFSPTVLLPIYGPLCYTLNGVFRVTKNADSTFFVYFLLCYKQCLM